MAGSSPIKSAYLHTFNSPRLIYLSAPPPYENWNKEESTQLITMQLSDAGTIL